MLSINLSPKAEHQPADKTVNNNGKTAQKRRVHNLIILDESGSMTSIYNAALTGLNETLQTIRLAQEENPEQEHFVTLVSFDWRNRVRYNEIYHRTPIGKTSAITREQYNPGGGTPLFDAAGRAITELRRDTKEGDVVLVTIITDGYENASVEYDAKAIRALIEGLRTKGWVFTFIGANQDVEKVAMSMSIKNHLTFDSTEQGTKEMFVKENASRVNFFKRININLDPDQNLDEGYFDK